MSAVNKVEVVIGGVIITLVSDEHEDYMQKLARYIDKKLAEIQAANPNASINERTRTLLISLNVADDYFKTQEKFQKLQEHHEKFVSEMGRMQEENHLLTERIYELQDQLNQSRAELEEYIATFDRSDPHKVVSMNPIIAKIL